MFLDVRNLKQLTEGMPSTLNDPTPNYIRIIRADTFVVSWYCDTQLDYFLYNKERVVFLDATGNISKSNEEKRQFYYTAVYKSEVSNEIVPVFDLLSCEHDIPSISYPLGKFYRDLKLRAIHLCQLRWLFLISHLH